LLFFSIIALYVVRINMNQIFLSPVTYIGYTARNGKMIMN
jgi:hypothetical protein